MPSLGDLPDPGVELMSFTPPDWQAGSLPLHHLEVPLLLSHGEIPDLSASFVVMGEKRGQ